MIIFYAPDIKATHTLPESDSAHAVRVLRLNPGDEMSVTDGYGHFYKCRLAVAHQKKAQVEIISEEEMPSFWKGPLTIAVAPTKNMDRMEWMTEKLTEIGIDRITPLLCRHSERKEIKTDRLIKTAVSAMKQSLKGILPEIDPMTPFRNFIDGNNSPQKYIAYCSDEFERHELSSLYDPDQGATILIGPEGDFSPEEVAHAVKAGYIPVSLGKARLRTETAAIAAIQTIHTLQSASDRLKNKTDKWTY